MDPDKDGLIKLPEWALHLNPTVPLFYSSAQKFASSQ
jgi:hypothetical protein